MDERVVTAPNGESMLIPVPEDLSASALALCEPWACVEDAYVDKQRQKLKSDGKMLVVGETQVTPQQLGQPVRPLRQACRHHLEDRRRDRRPEGRRLRRRRLFRRQRRHSRQALPEGRRAGPVQHRPVRRQVRPAGGVANRPRALRRHPRHRHDWLRPRGGDELHPRHGRDPCQGQDQHHRRRRPDGHDARHPRHLPGRAGCDGLRRRPERRAPGDAPEAGRAAGPEAQGLAAHLQSFQGEARRAVRLHRPHGARAGAGGGIGGLGGETGRLSTSSPASPPMSRPSWTSMPTSRSSSTSSAPAARRSTT